MCGDRTWVAAIRGATVMSAAFLMDRTGPCIKFKPASRLQRSIYISDSFRNRHGEKYVLLRNVLSALPRGKFVLITQGEYTATKHNKHVVSLVTESDKSHLSAFFLLGRAMDGPEFMKSLTQIDTDASRYGAGRQVLCF